MRNSHNQIFHSHSHPATTDATVTFQRRDIESSALAVGPIDVHINPIVSLVNDVVGHLPGQVATSIISSFETSILPPTETPSTSPSTGTLSTFPSSPTSHPNNSSPNSHGTRTLTSVTSANIPVTTVTTAFPIGSESSQGSLSNPSNLGSPSLLLSSGTNGNSLPTGVILTGNGAQQTPTNGSPEGSTVGTHPTTTSPDGSSGDILQSPGAAETDISGSDFPTNNHGGSGEHNGSLPTGGIVAIILVIMLAILLVLIYLYRGRRQRQQRRDQTTLGWRRAMRNRDSMSHSFQRTISSTGSPRSSSSSSSDENSINSTSPSMSERTTESHPESYSHRSRYSRSQLSIVPPSSSDHIDEPLDSATKEAFLVAHPPMSPSGERVMLIKTPSTPTQSEYESGSSSTRVNRVSYPVLVSYRPLSGKIPPIPPLPSSPPPVPDASTFEDRMDPFRDSATG
ncbi:hypothetical protein D9613_006299 [Agrocybe pediades]|uniref:Uncharacterized protein n=1 Tax=Agrocybe pediades TaxID=84607 RepID=A0A8H4QUZ4_9AGAR|nr:hypothetical protein D9613_006299 [Agrocybe pediades]